MRSLRHLVETILFAGVGGLIRLLPRSWARAFATLLGRFAFDGLLIRRRVSIANIEERLRPPGGRREAVRLARKSYEQMACTFVDSLRFDLLGRDVHWTQEMDRGIRPFLDAVREHGSAILVSAHFGNWELFLQRVGTLIPRLAVVVAEQSNVQVGNAVRRRRERGGVLTLSARRDIKKAMLHLREGGVLCSLMDQDARHKGIFVEFLGTPASTQTGLIRLAIHTRLPLVPGLLVDDLGRVQVFVGEPWMARKDRTLEENLRDGANHYSRFVEAHIRKYPDHYFWAHRRWKTRPPEERTSAQGLPTVGSAP